MPQDQLRAPYGWAGTVRAFLGLDAEACQRSLAKHHETLYGQRAAGSQQDAWRREISDLRTAFAEAVDDRPSAHEWGLALEFELVFEGGRRPDAVILAGQTIIVCEFKTQEVPTAASRDQLLGYVRDLREYHETSLDQPIAAVLVLGAGAGEPIERDDVIVSSPETIGGLSLELAGGPQRSLEEWLEGGYAPLPTLVQAAKRLFEHRPLPHVRRALSAHIPETLDLAGDLVTESRANGARDLVLITGAPGAGKTLVGLRLVYEKSEGAEATFLSGNGPLVAVLRDALGSGVFVRDLHKFITSYGRSTRTPSQRILVFDEAQRAWDRDYMLHKRGIDASEPELLVEIGDRLPDYACLVGLVGTGQEIFSGEEGGLAQWRDAIEESPNDWHVHCPPEVASSFVGIPHTEHALLHLEISLRARRAEHLHDWVLALFDDRLDEAAGLAHEMGSEQFPVYVSRDLDEAKAYVRERYSGELDPRFGLVASSNAKSLPGFGVDNSWIATSRMKIGPWYNAPPEDERSCCALEQPVTEFSCQGLELDLPIVCWGEDVRATDDGWELTPARRRYPLDDPEEILRNTYRVLLTRGRDGLVLWVPPDRAFDPTADALSTAGARETFQ